MQKSASSGVSLLGPGGLDLTHTFFTSILNSAPPSPTKRHNKVTVVGAGNVGMAVAQTILTQDLVDELVFVDALPDKLRGEMLDLQHAAAFLPRTKIHASTEYSVTAGSDLCIVTAGARQVSGESRLNLVQRNVSLFRSIIPPLVQHSPACVILVVSNPVDVLTYVAWKLSVFPANRVIGSGTNNLDSSRFRFLIADHLDVNAHDVQAYIVGEHGDSSVALWSSISVGGVPVLSFLEKQEIAYEKVTLEKIHKAVIESADEVIHLKGYTSWAIGYSVANLARSILRDQRKVHPVSVFAKGFHGIHGGEVFLSLPSQLGRGGVIGVSNTSETLPPPSLSYERNKKAGVRRLQRVVLSELAKRRRRDRGRRGRRRRRREGRGVSRWWWFSAERELHRTIAMEQRACVEEISTVPLPMEESTTLSPVEKSTAIKSCCHC